MSPLRRYLPFTTLVFAIAGSYLYQLNGVGMLDRDEPRYAAIGEAMAQTGDLVTPKLWGSPWFEKPPLLYWMTAAGATAGLTPELAARLPVALLSLCFLALSFVLLRREFVADAAGVATVLLATSAGWLTYSSLCLTDLPLAVFFSLALFLALPALRPKPALRHRHVRFCAIGACLGLAMLAKGLVPIALALPGLWYLRKQWRGLLLAILFCLLVAGPWYLAVYRRNGLVFLNEFFLKHHFERLYSASLQHVQPWYYYIPVLLGGLFPWTPFLLIVRPEKAWDQRQRLLLATCCFGFLFFSVSRNKLPGYLLPLLPALFALIGTYFESRPLRETRRIWLLPSALLIATIPLVAEALPRALAAGRVGAFHISPIPLTEWFYVAAPFAVLVLARRSWVEVLLVLCLVGGCLYLKAVAYPALDRDVSARGVWRQISQVNGTLCDAGLSREWQYGLSFYRGSPLPDCAAGRFDYQLVPQGRARPLLQRR